MEIFLIVLLGALVIGALYTVILYNGLVRLKHAVAQAWSNIDILLKQRHDELPKLVDTCSRYMRHEQETLQQVMQARNAVQQAGGRGDMSELGAAESRLRAGLGQLFAVAEAYPDLKANQQFQHLQNRISELEDSIADRREFYNESVNRNNVRIEQFPDLLLARVFAFHPAQLLTFSEQDRADVDIKALFD